MAAVITILRKPVVEQMTGLSGSTIDRLEASGQFPERIQMGPNSVGWYSAEITDWIASRPRVSGVEASAQLETYPSFSGLSPEQLEENRKKRAAKVEEAKQKRAKWIEEQTKTRSGNV